MLRPEPLDIMIIALVALLLFGANRLPETARAMAKGIREFRAAITYIQRLYLLVEQSQIPQLK